MTADALLIVLMIFVLRVINYAVGTLRLVAITRNRRLLASTMAALEALIFAVVIAGVVTDLDNIPNLIAYCMGAAVGSWTGMELESRLIRSYMIINIFASHEGAELTEKLRNAGFGVTTTISQGRDSEVLTLRSVVDKRDVKRFIKVTQEVNPDVFIAAEEARGVRRGYLGVGKGKSL
ncbi:MAG: DUF2179 domain-containing protein [Chloroflexota bacterium]